MNISCIDAFVLSFIERFVEQQVNLQFTTLINWYLVCVVKPLFTITEPPAHENFGILHIQQS